MVTRSPDSIVGIATGYGLDDRGVGVRVPVDGKYQKFSQYLFISLRVTSRYNLVGDLVRERAMLAACITMQPARMIKAFSFLPH
jgi:hypothetical protein